MQITCYTQQCQYDRSADDSTSGVAGRLPVRYIQLSERAAEFHSEELLDLLEFSTNRGKANVLYGLTKQNK